LDLINDTLGRPVGKRLLQAVAMRLRAALPELAGIACFGSGLFGVIEENITSGPYRARTIDHVRRSFEVPFVFDSETVFVEAQIGVAVSELGSDAHPECLIRRAEAAVYESEKNEVSSSAIGGWSSVPDRSQKSVGGK
jgi:PleD family two-component response regulator